MSKKKEGGEKANIEEKGVQRGEASMKKYLTAVLFGLMFTAAIGWAAESLDRYKESLATLKRIQSLETRVSDLEEQAAGLEGRLVRLHLRVEELSTQLRKH